MRLVADENLDLTVIGRLREAGHEVFAVVEMEPGIPDEAVLGLANAHGAMLVTEDKDFGELAFRQRLVHQGVILLRLAGLPPVTKAAMLIEMLEAHGLTILPLTAEQAFAAAGLPLLHRDPFDRLLTATAQLQRLTLLTPDPLIRQYPQVTTTW